MLEWRNVDVTAENATYGTATTINEGFVKAGSEYAQQSKGIASRYYSDTIYLRAYIELADGEYVYGPLVEYSVRQYCELMIDKYYNNYDSKVSEKQRALADACVALLYYGASAQEFFDYNLNDPANKNIVDRCPEPDWSADYLTSLVPANSSIVSDGTITDNGKELSLSAAILINYYFKTSIPDAKVASADLLYWAGVSGELTEANVTDIIPMIDAGSEYAVQSNAISAKNYGDTVYACARIIDTDGVVHYSPVIAFSPEEYTKGRLEKSSNEELKDVLKKMTIYGEYAKTFFSK